MVNIDTLHTVLEKKCWTPKQKDAATTPETQEERKTFL